MARPLRIEYPGAVYHVTARGNAQAAIYLDDADRRSFLDTLALAIERHAWLCHGYCLMDNHYHLLIETPTANLGRGMRHINGVYTQAFNRRHGRVGHLFQGRYKAILVEREAYLLELARYVVLNPVRAKLAGIKAASDWPWSSHRAVAGEAAAPDWLTVAWLRRQFGGDDATKAYRRFVADGMADRRSPLADGLQGAVTAGSVLGGDGFRAGLPAPIAKLGGEVPKRQRHLARPPLAELRAGAAPDDRTWMGQAQRAHGYTLAEIAAAAGCHYSTVSKIIKALETNSRRKT